MVPNFSRWLVPAALCAAAVAAQAQSATPANAARAASAARPDPLDAKANVPALAYESSFTRYRRSSDDKAVSWRDANDAVARIGGWRAYAREAQEPASAPPAASTSMAVPMSKPSGTGQDTAKPLPMPAPPGHTGHKTP
jgi:hypothetical protein